MNPITIPNITIPVIGLPTIGIPSVGFPSASGGGLAWPAGLKESIKAIYDPAKQGMTNYDVIESYAEDFSKFPWNNNNKKEKYTGTLTPNTLTITNVAVTSALIYTNSKPENFKVYITGIKDNQQVIFGDDTSPYRALIVEKDGVYDVNWEDNHHSYCIWCNFLGDCNITITQLPTSILKDLSGNGNHAYLYGGKGKLNSGMGVYKFDFLSDLLINSAYLPYTERQYDSICSLAGHPNGWLFQYKSLTDIPTFKIEVKGIVNDKFHYRWYDENGNRGVDFVIDKDGIYEFPMSYSVETNTGVGIVCNNICQDNVCFTQIPDYPNQLCYDGKMYAVCYGFPILTDYTVMAERTWFKNKGSYAFISKRTIGNIMGNAFVFEKDDNTGTPNSLRVYSFGAESIIMPNKNNSISYQTKTKYNNQNIRYGGNKDSSILMIGAGLYRSDQNLITELWSGCHGAIIIADRSFTEDEITWLKDNWKKI
ncbi:hypothetical protein [Bacteroides clarus]|jgi:hypothetical protein|uniref:hypothetical protein n=1 Tax=Bacteroides clarus TaxID=626929 RepID=UPI0011DE1C16|nr:hypothetical protein [Bacteroides clarus]